MKSADEEFNGLMKTFKNSRALEYEKLYNSNHGFDEKNARFMELCVKMEKILGEENLRLLNAYTDSVIAMYNTDADYFYNCGFSDSESFAAARGNPRSD